MHTALASVEMGIRVKCIKLHVQIEVVITSQVDLNLPAVRLFATILHLVFRIEAIVTIEHLNACVVN